MITKTIELSPGGHLQETLEFLRDPSFERIRKTDLLQEPLAAKVLERFLFPILTTIGHIDVDAAEFLNMAFDIKLSLIEAIDLWLKLLDIDMLCNFKEIFNCFKESTGLDHIIKVLKQVKKLHIDLSQQRVSDIINIVVASIERNISEKDCQNFIESADEEKAPQG